VAYCRYEDLSGAWVDEGMSGACDALAHAFAAHAQAARVAELEAIMEAISTMMAGIIVNWPQPKKLQTALRLIAKTFGELRADEREECAKVAAGHRPDRTKPISAYDREDRGVIRAEENGEKIAAYCIAAAIRARGDAG
jgi:hypothetical protein